MRDALVKGDLLAFIKAHNDQMEQLVDRESWRRKAFGVPGIESVPHHLTNPGPDTHGQPIFLKRSNFDNWLTRHSPKKPLNLPKKISEFDSELYSKMSDLLTRGEATSISEAAKLVANQAKTRGGTPESVAKRLARGYSRHMV
jgi:hypothetical protein